MARLLQKPQEFPTANVAGVVPFVVGIGLTLTPNASVYELIVNDVVSPALVSALIEKTANIVGGSASITRTRIPVWTLEKFRRLGASDAQLLEAFPSLRAVDLQAAWAYASMHAEEVNLDIQENEAA
jgi:uncharacterized protein (DUF433 family)